MGQATAEDAFMRVTEYAQARGEVPIKSLWSAKVGDLWEVWVNGGQETADTVEHVPVRPFTMYVEFNGWPWGDFDLIRGVAEVGDGGGATLDTFCAAVVAATPKGVMA